MESSIVNNRSFYQILNISTDLIIGRDLTNETDFAADLKAGFDKLVFSNNIKCGYLVGKIVMCISFEMNDIPDSQDAGKFLDLLEKSFQKKKILRRIGWTANYVMDKNNNPDTLVLDFLFFNKSPNRYDNIQTVQEYEICTCFHCFVGDLV